LAESERLHRREGKLEFVRTKELLTRFLPPPPARVIDIGGGTGVYASWLAGQGYDVHLIDIVPSLVDVAAKAGTFTTAIGDARAVAEPDGMFDAALLLGPLYHLQDGGDRLRALREAGRVIRREGIIAAAFISRGAAALDGYVKGWIDNIHAAEIVGAQLRAGFPETERTGFGAVSYFHLPSEAHSELTAAGMEVFTVLGVEGPGWVAPDFDERWANLESRQTMLDMARTSEEHPELQMLSAHLLAFCTVNRERMSST
jgi:SAM-dependent methyltransferase